MADFQSFSESEASCDLLNATKTTRVLNKNEFSHYNESPEKYEGIDNPETIVTLLLTQFITCMDVEEIDGELAVQLVGLSKIRETLQNTSLLNYVDIRLLKTNEQRTAFLANLANLLWIHAMLAKCEERNEENCLISKNWVSRQLEKSFVGYNVGDLGFVSLYDMHSKLLGYPDALRTKCLQFFPILKNPNLVFALAQAEVSSPKIKVLDSGNIAAKLLELKREYLQQYMLEKGEDGGFAIPRCVYYYVEQMLQYQCEGKDVKEGGLKPTQQKLNLIRDFFRDNNVPCNDLDQRSVYFINDTKFSIKFSYKKIPSLCGQRKKEHRTPWKSCPLHKSMLICFEKQLSIVKSSLRGKHTRSLDCCEMNAGNRLPREGEVCVNELLRATYEMYGPPLRFGDYCGMNFGMQCLVPVLSFLLASYTNVEETEENMGLAQIINTFFITVPLENICWKIRTCVQLLDEEPKMEFEWNNSWYKIFSGNANDVLTDLIRFKRLDLARCWVEAQFKFNPSFKFANEVLTAYVKVLTQQEDKGGLLDMFSHSFSKQISAICEYLVKNCYPELPAPSLAKLIRAAVRSNKLGPAVSKKFHAACVGLRMICRIPVMEQPPYLDIVWSPLLIAEQLLIGEKIAALGGALEEMHTYQNENDDAARVEGLSQAGVDELLRIYANKAILFADNQPRYSSPFSEEDLRNIIYRDDYIPPPQPPQIADWIPNQKASNCMCCKGVFFTMFNRRHHCRRCGRIICNKCSTHRCKVGKYEGLVRICDQCFKFESETESEIKDDDSCSVVIEENDKGGKWRLKMHEEHNEHIRRQFLYDCAPSVSLCLSILELHSEHIAIPRFLYSRCESLARILRVRTSKNFNYEQITQLVRSLLLATKIYYTHLGEGTGVQHCEDLTAEVDLLTRLAGANFKGLYPAKPVRGMEELKRIRDRLLEKQEWTLALEISTKIGLECQSIWFVWGKARLKVGDLPGAREKFARSGLDRNPFMLENILDMIYDRFPNKGLEGQFEVTQAAYDECCYYLRTYGVPVLAVKFHMRMGEVKKALDLTLAKRVSPEAFWERIFAPRLQRATYQSLLDAMEAEDETLEKWASYLREICGRLEREGKMEVLLDMQVWTKDYARAAISCIHFFSEGANCYDHLSQRTHFLKTACKHLEAAGVGTERSASVIMKIKPPDLVKHINTVCMQINVTNMIAMCPVTASCEFEQVPTLFDGQEGITRIIPLIFQSNKDIKNAFDMSQRLVIEYALNEKGIYSCIATMLMANNREAHLIELITQVKNFAMKTEVIDAIVIEAMKSNPVRVETFINLISDSSTKTSLYVEKGMLKSAYLLAVKHNRLDFVEQILGKAHASGVKAIEKLCLQKLKQRSSE